MTHYVKVHWRNDGKEYNPGDKVDLSDNAFLAELIARGIVTDRPPHRSNVRKADNADKE